MTVSYTHLDVYKRQVSAVLGVIWEKFGAEYVFFLTAATSLMQIGVGLYMGRQLAKQEMQR